MTFNNDEVGALLRLDPVKIVNLAMQKDGSIFDQVKEFSIKLAHLVENNNNNNNNKRRSIQENNNTKKEEEYDDDECNNNYGPIQKRQKVSIEKGATSTTTNSCNDKDKKPTEEEDILRYDLAVAHRLTSKLGMDMLVWNHISARYKGGCLITPGRQLWSNIKPSDLVFSSSNITADIIHAALYKARSDVKAIIHLHTPAATAISCLECGFVPYTQDSAYFYGKVANYNWDGVSNEESEGPAIADAVKSVPNCNTLLMHNHGFVCFGKSVREVWILAYYFERACQIQLDLLKTTGAKIKLPDPKVMEKASQTSYLPDFAPGACEWEALCKEISFDE